MLPAPCQARRVPLGLAAAFLGLLAAAGPARAQAAAEPAFKVTSVHFSPAVKAQLEGVLTPLEVTQTWQKALSQRAKFRVIGFDEPVSNAEFKGALLAASATVTKTDLYRIEIGQKQGGYIAAMCALTATFLDPATGEVFYQSYVEVSSPEGFLSLFEKDEDIDIKNLTRYYQAVPDVNVEAFAKKQFRGLVLAGLEKLATQAAAKYQPAVEEGKVLGQWNLADGKSAVSVDLGFSNGLVRGSIVRLYNPREQDKPVARAEVQQVEDKAAVCRVLDVQFGREIREGFIARAIGVNRLQRPRAGSLVLQVTGFGGEHHATYDPSFHVDQDVFSMWLSEALSQGGDFFLLAPLPSVSAVADTAEFAQGVEVAEEDIFGRRRIADVGIKGNFFKASIVREVLSSEKLRKLGVGDLGTRLHQELELRLGLEFYDLYTGQLLFTSETKRVQELVDEIYDADGNQVTDVSEEAGFRRLARSLIRQAAEDVRKRFRGTSVSGTIRDVQGSALTIGLDGGAKLGPKALLTVWRPGSADAAAPQDRFARRLGLASVDSVEGSNVKATFVPAKGVEETPRTGDQAQMRAGAEAGGTQLPVVQAQQVALGEGLDSHMKVSPESLVELIHVALGSVSTVRAVPPTYRAVELEKDAQLFRDGDYNLEQAEKMLQAKVESVDYVLRGKVESANLEVRKEGGARIPVFTLKMRVQLVDPATGKVLAEAAASGERRPKDLSAATLVRGGEVVQGVREEDYPQEFEYLSKDLLDKLVPHVIKKGLTPT
jgi:hypothetical protein